MASGVAAFFIIALVAAILAAAGWVGFTQWRAHKYNLPPPPISSYIPFLKRNNSSFGSSDTGGVMGWIGGRYQAFKNRNNRSAAGAFESAGGGSGQGRSHRGFGPLDPDDAWDARVDHEADTFGPGGYYEEQELARRDPGRSPSSTTGLGQNNYDGSSGRTDVPTPYLGARNTVPERGNDESANRTPRSNNPFDDQPLTRVEGDEPDSPQSTKQERRSIFQEGV